MGWHTNNRAPGVRIYVTHAEEPGRSFFRYRDPDTDQVVTAPDDRWNVRAFRVGSEKPFWHAVYSETHRFSFGYMISGQASLTNRRERTSRPIFSSRSISPSRCDGSTTTPLPM